MSKSEILEAIKIKLTDFKGLLAMRDEHLLLAFQETDIETLINQLD